MNNFSVTVMTLIHYNVLVRDTLKYALNNNDYTIEEFEYRKKGIKIELEFPTPLKHFIEKNEQKGKEITDQINDLYATVYADDSTICKKANNELRVDQGQHIAIYDVVLPLHENIKKLIDMHLNYGRTNKILEDDLMKLVVADERFYRAIGFLSLYRDLESLFVEYNKARNESKGEITPQSNFIQGELIKIVNHLKFLRDNQSATDIEYWDMVDYVFKTVDQTVGRRQLPEGKHFKDIFEEGNKIINAFFTKALEEWKNLYNPAIKEVSEITKKNNNQIKVDVNEEKKN